MKFNILKALYIIFFLYISIYGFLNIYTDNLYTEKDFYIWGIVSIILLIFGIITWYKEFKNFKSPFIYYFFISYLYFFGQVLLKMFGYNNSHNKLEINSFTNYPVLINTMIFSCISFGMIFLGAITFSKLFKLSTKETVNEEIQDPYCKKATLFVGILMFIISAPIYLAVIIQNLYISMTYGYLGIFNYSNELENVSTIGNLTYFKMFFMSSIFLILAYGKNNKKIIRFCNLIMIVYISLMFASGTRAGCITLLLAYLWYYFISIKKIDIKKLVIVGILGMLLLKFVIVIEKVRIIEDRTIDDYVKVITDEDDSTLISVAKEMGYNILPTYYTIDILNTTNQFGHGYTYFAAVMAIVPSFLFGGYSFASTAVLSDWLMNQLNMNYSPGYSLIAESYYNFGYGGAIVMFFIGGIIMFMLSNKKVEHDDIIIKNALIASSITFLAISARMTSTLMLKYYVYTIIIPTIAIKLIANTLRKKEAK